MCHTHNIIIYAEIVVCINWAPLYMVPAGICVWKMSVCSDELFISASPSLMMWSTDEPLMKYQHPILIYSPEVKHI